VREERRNDPGLCFVARVATLLVGSVRQTPIRIGDHAGR
jgi:predicted N-acetyltransferase YhbS